ncbi:hypothetical protein BSX62_005060 [Escherichia coli]|nr:hypothetical protein [Escherichia coli]EFF8127401.1 hypothetical protein [Escherichia coli]
MLPSETMIWQPEFTDKTLSRKPGAVQRHLNSDLMNAIFTSNAWCATSIKAEISFPIASN